MKCALYLVLFNLIDYKLPVGSVFYVPHDQISKEFLVKLYINTVSLRNVRFVTKLAKFILLILVNRFKLLVKCKRRLTIICYDAIKSVPKNWILVTFYPRLKYPVFPLIIAPVLRPIFEEVLHLEIS